MRRTSFHVIHLSRRTVLIIAVTVVIVCALVIYNVMQRQRHASPVSNVAVALDEPAPLFTLFDVAGNEVTPETWRNKARVLIFWTTWCPDCAEQLQMIAQVHAQSDPSGNVALVGINLMEDAATVSRYAAQHQLRFPLLLDVDAVVSNDFSIRIVPSVVIVDEYGYVSSRMFGNVHKDTFAARLQAVIPRAEP